MPSHDSLNFFDSNTNIPAHHENQLTRAFLVVLRMSPAAHQVWLSLVAPQLKLYRLPRKPSFDTQRWKMMEEISEASEPIAGISVFQITDAKVIDKPIQITDRAQVLDGIVRYGDELLIVIETKLAAPVSSRQAEYLNVHGAQVHFDGHVKAVDWRDLLEAWSDLVESDVVSGTERALIEDFLIYVERHFPQLGPFRTLAQCRENAFRIRMRLNAVLDQMAGGLTNPWLKLPQRATVDRAFLEFNELSQRIQLVIYPADTLTQAKAFYTRPDAVSGILSLRKDGWSVEPNFHFGHMASGFVWTTAEAQLEEYMAYWSKGIENTRAVPREQWEGFWSKLVRQRFARSDGKEEFDLRFTNTNRSSATPRPGLKSAYRWSLSDARSLDDKGQFVTAVTRQLNTVLRVIGEEPFGSLKPDLPS
jgi:hypothetical protein